MQTQKTPEPLTRTSDLHDGRTVITDPSFFSPPKPIADFASRTDFPMCTLGEHIDVVGYTGVVVEIVAHSLKVRSVEGVTRSYNAMVLRRLYGSVDRAE